MYLHQLLYTDIGFKITPSSKWLKMVICRLKMAIFALSKVLLSLDLLLGVPSKMRPFMYFEHPGWSRLNLAANDSNG